jgi:hypothetical protein
MDFPLKFVSELIFDQNKIFLLCFLSEIPLYHVLTAKVTFGNIHGIDKTVEGVSTIKENLNSFCAVDENIFAVPQGYRRQGLSTENIN